MWWWWFSQSVMSDSNDPMDCSLPGSSVHGILQARRMECLPFPSPGNSNDKTVYFEVVTQTEFSMIYNITEKKYSHLILKSYY